jgi:hypothetical protein
MRINYAAVVVSALAYWVLGAVWYGLFSAPFVALMRWTPEQVARIQAEGAGREIGVALLASLLTSYVLAHFVKFTGADSASKGAQTGFWLWLGFVLTTNLNTVLFEFRPLGLYLINSGYHLVGLLGMGAVLAVWKRKEARVAAYQT